jgi:chromosome segregation ATPase
MGLFTTQAEWKQKVEGLEASLEQSGKDLEAVKLELAEAKDDLATAREALNEAPKADEVATLKADLATAQAAAAPEVIEAKAVELASAENPPEAIQKVIASRVTEELAGAGHDKPIAETDTDAGSKTMPHADFNKLPHAKRNAFIRDGGKITP